MTILLLEKAEQNERVLRKNGHIGKEKLTIPGVPRRLVKLYASKGKTYSGIIVY